MPKDIGIFAVKQLLYALHLNMQENFRFIHNISLIMFGCKPCRDMFLEIKCRKQQ